MTTFTLPAELRPPPLQLRLSWRGEDGQHARSDAELLVDRLSVPLFMYEGQLAARYRLELSKVGGGLSAALDAVRPSLRCSTMTHPRLAGLRTVHGTDQWGDAPEGLTLPVGFYAPGAFDISSVILVVPPVPSAPSRELPPRADGTADEGEGDDDDVDDDAAEVAAEQAAWLARRVLPVRQFDLNDPPSELNALKLTPAPVVCLAYSDNRKFLLLSPISPITQS